MREKEGTGVGGRGGGADSGDEEEDCGGEGEMGLLLFLTHTWQMSDHWVGLREGETSVVVVSQIEKRFPFSFQCAFKRGFQEKLLSGLGPGRRLCKNSPTVL